MAVGTVHCQTRKTEPSSMETDVSAVKAALRNYPQGIDKEFQPRSSGSYPLKPTLARPQPHLIREASGFERMVSQARFHELLAGGLIFKVRKKYAVIREGYYCFEDQETGQLRFMAMALSAATDDRGTSWNDTSKYQPPFPAQIDLDYLMREGQARNDALQFLEQQEMHGYESVMYRAANNVLNLR